MTEQIPANGPQCGLVELAALSGCSGCGRKQRRMLPQLLRIVGECQHIGLERSYFGRAVGQRTGRLSHLLYGWQKQPDQDRDDRDYDEQLDERKPPLIPDARKLHVCLPCGICGAVC